MQTEPNHEEGAIQSAIRPEADEGAPDFTPEQWAEIMERSRLLEDGYVPTRSLFPGL